MTAAELQRLRREADVAPTCGRFFDQQGCDCPQCRLAAFEQGSGVVMDEAAAETSAIAALDRIRLAREAVAKLEAAEKKAKEAHKVARRELDFARADLERLLNTETVPHLFNQRTA
jgi:hypothetical protein